MEVATRHRGIGGIGIERADFEGFLAFQVVQEKLAATVLAGIAVRQHPLAIRRVGAMSVSGEDVLGDYFGLVGLIRVEVVLPASQMPIGVVDDLVRRSPSIVAGHVFQVEGPDFAAIDIGGKHVGNVPARSAIGLPNSPAMEECDSLAVRAEEQVIEPTRRVFHIGAIEHLGDLRDADNQLRGIVLQVNQVDSIVLRRLHIDPWIAPSRVSVSRPFTVEP